MESCDAGSYLKQLAGVPGAASEQIAVQESPVRAEDIEVCGRICFEAFTTLNLAHQDSRSYMWTQFLARLIPVPSEHKVIDQKGLTFDPHIAVVQAGTTVDFQNDDSVQHNVFCLPWAATKRRATTWGLGPRVTNALSSSINLVWCHCSAMFTRKCQATSWSARRRILHKLMPVATLRSRMFLTESTTLSPGTRA